MRRTTPLVAGFAAALAIVLIGALFPAGRGIAQTPAATQAVPTQITSNITPVSLTPLPTQSITVPPPVFQQPSQQGIVYGNNSICGLPLPAAIGGQTISDASGGLQVYLSEGGNYSYGERIVAGQPAFSICHAQTNSTLVLSPITGREITRVVRDGGGHTILNRILAGVQFTGSAAATQFGAQAGITGTIGAGGIRPPSTGDGGLR